MIRLALVCTSAVLLSGCSWLGNWTGSSENVGRRMNLELAVGAEKSVHGQLTNGAFDNTGTAELISTDYGDAYDTPIRYAVGGSYSVSDTVDVTASVHYAKGEGKALDMGTVGADTITAQFDDLETWGGEIGVRKYFRNKTFAHLLSPAVSPYVGANVGVQHVESTSAIVSSAGFAGIGLPADIQAEFYDDSLVPTAQLTVGAEWRASRNFAIGLETGVRWTGDLDAGDATLAAIGWDESRDDAQNVTIPVTLRGRFKF